MENRPTNLDQIIEGMNEEVKNGSEHFLKSIKGVTHIPDRSLVELRKLTGRPEITQRQADEYFARVRKFKAENPNLAQQKNLELVKKEREYQMKNPEDLETLIARQRLNAMDHADHSEYLRKIEELEKAAFKRKQQKENSQNHPTSDNPNKLNNILSAMNDVDRARSGKNGVN